MKGMEEQRKQQQPKTYAFQSQILDNINWIVYFRIELHQTKHVNNNNNNSNGK